MAALLEVPGLIKALVVTAYFRVGEGLSPENLGVFAADDENWTCAKVTSGVGTIHGVGAVRPRARLFCR